MDDDDVPAGGGTALRQSYAGLAAWMVRFNRASEPSRSPHPTRAEQPNRVLDKSRRPAPKSSDEATSTKSRNLSRSWSPEEEGRLISRVGDGATAEKLENGWVEHVGRFTLASSAFRGSGGKRAEQAGNSSRSCTLFKPYRLALLFRQLPLQSSGHHSPHMHVSPVAETLTAGSIGKVSRCCGGGPKKRDWQRLMTHRRRAVTGHQPIPLTIDHRGLVTSTAVRMGIENPLAIEAGGFFVD